MSPKISIRLLTAQSDQRLLALVKDGHERAFEALVQRYRRPLLRYCRRMQLSEARAEDVLQQAFLQAWLALARGTEVREVRPWLYRIAHNAAVNAMRGSAESYGELTEALQAQAASARGSNLESAIAVREALTEVAALPQMQRQAIFLTAVDGQSHDEVAGVLGITPGALRGLLYRARATLRSAAAAITPAPLLQWAAGGSGSTGPSVERLAELTGGSGAVGMAGLLLKGAVVAVTAGAVAGGVTVVDLHRAGVPRTPNRVSLVRDARSSAGAGPVAAGAASSALGASPSTLRARAGGDSKGKHAAQRSDGHSNGRRRDGGRSTRREDREPLVAQHGERGGSDPGPSDDVKTPLGSGPDASRGKGDGATSGAAGHADGGTNSKSGRGTGSSDDDRGVAGADLDATVDSGAGGGKPQEDGSSDQAAVSAPAVAPSESTPSVESAKGGSDDASAADDESTSGSKGGKGS